MKKKIDYTGKGAHDPQGLTLNSILLVRAHLAQVIPVCEKCHNRAAVCRFDGVAYCRRCATQDSTRDKRGFDVME